MDPDGYDTIILPDLRFSIPREVDRFEARLLEAFPAEHRGIRRYISFIRQIQAIQGLAGQPLSALWTLPRCLTVLCASEILGHGFARDVMRSVCAPVDMHSSFGSGSHRTVPAT